MNLFEGMLGGGASPSPPSPPVPPPSPPAPLLLEQQAVLEQAILPFIEHCRGGRQNFSLVEFGSWSGTYSLELSPAFPRSTLVVLEPNRTLWQQHGTLARRLRRRNLVMIQNTLTEGVLEALSHANEFFDAQLLLSLTTHQPFDHGEQVSPELLKRLDTYVGHLLTLSRRSLFLLPAPGAKPECRDTRLYNWAHHSTAAHRTDDPDAAIPYRLRSAAGALGLRVSSSRVMEGMLPDGCAHEVWESTLLSMDRLNRHHFCVGGCKTHTRRTYRMAYTAADPADAAAFELAPRSLRLGFMNMTNTQTSRHIPFETGSLNMHTLLSLTAGTAAPQKDKGETGGDVTRQALILMFLSLPVYQDPAPWNVVWRAGELFPIDVGDGLTMEQRTPPEGKSQWDTFAQKYIGSLNECYRMSLKTLCSLSETHGDGTYEQCMGWQFEGICPAQTPFPCGLGNCSRGYQHCAHLPPERIVPGYFSSNRHLLAHRTRFVQYATPPCTPVPGIECEPLPEAEPATRFGSRDIELALRASAARRERRARRAMIARDDDAEPPPAPKPKKHHHHLSPPPQPPPSPSKRSKKSREAAAGTERAGEEADSPAGRESSFPLHKPRAADSSRDADKVPSWLDRDDPELASIERGLALVMAARGIPHEPRAHHGEEWEAEGGNGRWEDEAEDSAAGRTPTAAGGGGRGLRAAQSVATAVEAMRVAYIPLTLLQLAMMLVVGVQLCNRSSRGRRCWPCASRRPTRSRAVGSLTGVTTRRPWPPRWRRPGCGRTGCTPSGRRTRPPRARTRPRPRWPRAAWRCRLMRAGTAGRSSAPPRPTCARWWPCGSGTPRRRPARAPRPWASSGCCPPSLPRSSTRASAATAPSAGRAAAGCACVSQSACPTPPTLGAPGSSTPPSTAARTTRSVGSPS